MSDETPKCELCGEPMPAGEEMFKIHGYSCDCPKPPLPKEPQIDYRDLARRLADICKAYREFTPKRFHVRSPLITCDCELCKLNRCADAVLADWAKAEGGGA
jgi:hypothetical protein